MEGRRLVLRPDGYRGVTVDADVDVFGGECLVLQVARATCTEVLLFVDDETKPGRRS